MASTGFQYPGTVDGVWAGGNDWTAPNNVKLNDGVNATWVGAKFPASGIDDGPSLKTTNYGFSIPDGATITGVECRIEGATDANQVSDLVYLTELGSPINLGTEKRLAWTTFGGTITTFTFGSSSDLWGATLTPAVVNQTNFGWIFMIYDDVAPLNCLVDYMQMNIHYEEPAGTPPIILMIGA